MVIAFDGCDNFGSPLCVEMYNFSPAAVMAKISIPDYIEFTKHSLEYKYLIVEQLSEHKERADATGKGMLVYTCVVRDLAGVGLEHVGSNGQEIIQAVISLASPNYPELMRKCFMINVPWVFNALWFVATFSPLTGITLRVVGHLFGRAFGHQVAAPYSALGAKVEQIVGRLDDVHVVFN